MKILFYCDTVFSFGGVQRVLAQVAKALSDSHDVTILTTDRNYDQTMYSYHSSTVSFEHIVYEKASWIEAKICKAYGGCYKYLLPQCRFTSAIYSRTFFLPTYRKLLVDRINSGKYDVVIGVHAYCSLHVAAVKSQLEARTVGWMHNSYEAFFEKQNSYLPKLKHFFQHEMAGLDKIIVLSRTDKEKYERNLSLKPDVIYNPLTVKVIGKADLQSKHFLSVGRFSEKHKGFDLLLEAFALFAVKNKEWMLDIVGEGPEKPLYHSLIAQHRLEDRVRIHSFTKDIHLHYARSSVYVLASRWEGMPLVLMESMAYGLPIIASDIPIARELLEEKGMAVLFEKENSCQLADCLEYMAQRADLSRMSEKSVAYAACFETEQIITQWKKIIN